MKAQFVNESIFKGPNKQEILDRVKVVVKKKEPEYSRYEVLFYHNGKALDVPSSKYKFLFHNLISPYAHFDLVYRGKEVDPWSLELFYKDKPINVSGDIFKDLFEERILDDVELRVVVDEYGDTSIRKFYKGKQFTIMHNYDFPIREKLKENPELVQEYYEKAVSDDEVKHFFERVKELDEPEDLYSIHLLLFPSRIWFYLEDKKRYNLDEVKAYEDVINKLKKIFQEMPEYIDSLSQEEAIDYLGQLDYNGILKVLIKLFKNEDFYKEIVSAAYSKINQAGSVDRELMNKIKSASKIVADLMSELSSKK